MPQQSLSDDEWAAWRAFVAMQHELTRVIDRQLQREGSVTRAEFDVLTALLEAPDRRLRSRALAETLGWEGSRVSHQVARMVKRGLVLREECDTDLRGSWVVLADGGRQAVLETMREHAASIRRYFFDVLDDAELAHLGDISSRVLAAIDPPVCDELADPATRAPAAAGTPAASGSHA